MGEVCSTHGSCVICVQNFSRDREGRRPLEGRRRRLADNIKTDIRDECKKCGCELDSSGLG
jgi:hypothetical protein